MNWSRPTFGQRFTARSNMAVPDGSMNGWVATAPAASASEATARVSADALLRAGAVLYAAIAYVLFLVALLWAVGFVGNLGGPTSVDSGVSNPPRQALGIDLSLLGLFAVQHSVMARAGFK